MIAVKVTITKFVDDAQPGWVECSLTDIYGKRWSFIEKVPVVSQTDLDASSDYPLDGVIACSILKSWLDVDGNEHITIDTDNPWGISSTVETNLFDVRRDQLIEI